MSGILSGAGTSGGTNARNATVSLNAPIQPPQGYVNYATDLMALLHGTFEDAADNDSTTPVGLTRLRLKSLWESHYAALTADVVWPPYLDLHDCAMNSEEIDALLADAVAFDEADTQANKELYLFGTNMANPTPFVANVACDVTLQITTSVISETFLQFTSTYGTDLEIAFDSLTALAASNYSARVMTIGVLGAPTVAQVAAKIAELLPDAAADTEGITFTVAGTTLRIESAFGLDATTSPAPIGGSFGTVEVKNQDLDYLSNAAFFLNWHGDYKDSLGYQITF